MIRLKAYIDYHQQALKHFETLNDPSRCYTMVNISAIYQNQGNIEKAIEFIERSQKVFEEQKNYSAIGTCQNNLGSIYKEAGKYESNQLGMSIILFLLLIMKHMF